MAQDDCGYICCTATNNFNIVFIAYLIEPMMFKESFVIRFRNPWPIFVSTFSLYGGLNQTMLLLLLLKVFVVL